MRAVSDETPEPALIRARNQQQAFDWSLVLASQGIECALDHNAQSGAWQLLLLEAADHTRALAALRQFNQENRRSRWEHPLPDSELNFHAGVLAWVGVLALLHIFSDQLTAGEFRYAAAARGEWWRAFTAVWLHADAAHLASNAIMGTLLLGLAMARFGAGLACWATLLAGATANWVALEFRRTELGYGLGASGMVMAALGMMAAQALPLWRHGRRGTRVLLAGLAGGTLMFVQFGTAITTDVLAHAVGFGAGLVLGGLAAFLPPRLSSPANRLGGLAFVALSVGSWLVALTR